MNSKASAAVFFKRFYYISSFFTLDTPFSSPKPDKPNTRW